MAIITGMNSKPAWLLCLTPESKSQEEAASWHALTTHLCLGFEDQAEQKPGFSAHKTTKIRLDSGQLKNEQTKS